MIHKLLQITRDTRSRIQKTNAIADFGKDACVQDILVAAYHPLKHYGIKKTPWVGSGSLTLAESRGIWQSILDDLETGRLSGDNAKHRVGRFIDSLTPEDGEVFTQILKKDLRAGFSANTINAAINGLIPVFGAMLAKSYSGTLDKPMYMSLKHDGLRAIFKDGKFYTRNGHEITGIAHLMHDLVSLGVDSLDSELMIPDMHFQKSSGLIRSRTATPDAILQAFDIPNLTSEFHHRYSELKNLDVKLAVRNITNIKVVKHVLTQSQRKVEETFQKALDAGYEGLVLKDPTHLYQTKRSADWLKLKAVKDEDLKTIGFFEGEGKYEGTLGGIIVDYNGVDVRVGSGFSDGMRDEVWNNQAMYVAATAEVHYHEVTPDGSLRHPRFKGFRTDK